MASTRPDDSTLSYYEEHAARIAAGYEQVDLKPTLDRMTAWLPDRARVLELGCGSGRDAACLLRRGFDVTGIDASAAMAAEAVAYHPELAGRLSVHRLPEPLPFPDERFEAVFSLATLMHLAPDEIPAVLSECRRVLRAPGSGRGRSAARAPGGGILAVSVPTERPDLDGAGVDERGRRFTVLSRTEWKGLVADAGFEVAESFCSPDAAGREGITWATVIARKA